MADRYIKFERELSGPNEVFAPDGAVFSHYRPVLEEIERMGPEEWNRRVRRAHERMLEEQRPLRRFDPQPLRGGAEPADGLRSRMPSAARKKKKTQHKEK